MHLTNPTMAHVSACGEETPVSTRERDDVTCEKCLAWLKQLDDLNLSYEIPETN